MSTRTLRWQLRAAALLLLLAAVATVVWGLQSPRGGTPANEQRARIRVPQTRLVKSPPLAEFAQYWNQPLRRPLRDPPQPSKPRIARPVPRPAQPRSAVGGLKLVGTMLEDGRSKAIFMNSAGQIDVREAGQVLEVASGVRVDRIESQRVTVSTRGRSTTLQLPQPGGP